jgi:hypothetical protein
MTAAAAVNCEREAVPSRSTQVLQRHSLPFHASLASLRMDNLNKEQVLMRRRQGTRYHTAQFYLVLYSVPFGEI